MPYMNKAKYTFQEDKKHDPTQETTGVLTYANIFLTAWVNYRATEWHDVKIWVCSLGFYLAI